MALTAKASDNFGVDSVEFKVDGNLVGTDTSNPYSVLWENTDVYAPNLSDTIEAIAAVDSSGNRTVAGSPGSSITVDLDGPGYDIQIDDGGVPRTNCASAPSPCNVGTVNPGDTIKLLLDSPAPSRQDRLSRAGTAASPSPARAIRHRSVA